MGKTQVTPPLPGAGRMARMKILLGGIDITVAPLGMATVDSFSFRLTCGHSIRVRQSHATLAMGVWNSSLLMRQCMS